MAKKSKTASKSADEITEKPTGKSPAGKPVSSTVAKPSGKPAKSEADQLIDSIPSTTTLAYRNGQGAPIGKLGYHDEKSIAKFDPKNNPYMNKPRAKNTANVSKPVAVKAPETAMAPEGQSKTSYVSPSIESSSSSSTSAMTPARAAAKQGKKPMAMASDPNKKKAFYTKQRQDAEAGADSGSRSDAGMAARIAEKQGKFGKAIHYGSIKNVGKGVTDVAEGAGKLLDNVTKYGAMAVSPAGKAGLAASAGKAALKGGKAALKGAEDLGARALGGIRSMFPAARPAEMEATKKAVQGAAAGARRALPGSTKPISSGMKNVTPKAGAKATFRADGSRVVSKPKSGKFAADGARIDAKAPSKAVGANKPLSEGSRALNPSKGGTKGISQADARAMRARERASGAPQPKPKSSVKNPALARAMEGMGGDLKSGATKAERAKQRLSGLVSKAKSEAKYAGSSLKKGAKKAGRFAKDVAEDVVATARGK